ncbi:MAG TPA: dynamin family protein [Usitatibacter sp.]|nr:dynamin family protein [Usitatibacter sp.]
MSTTGAGVPQAGSFEASLAALREWRGEVAGALASFRRWAITGRIIDEQAATRLAHLEQRLAGERLTIAFVAEQSRGKSELINALFFAAHGARLLPASGGKILCPVEIAWDASRPPSIRLLPIETRDEGHALREYFGDPRAWREDPLDPQKPESIAAACEVLTQSREVNGAAVPRWRYAIVNYPHPVLAAGVTLLDTAGLATLASEPELSFHRVPDAAAVVFVVSAENAVAEADRALWNEHVATISGVHDTCFVVLNKIDGLRDGSRGEGQVLSEIDRQVRIVADALDVDPTRIFALSAKQGLNAKLTGDRDALLKSRLYRLEQALSRGMSRQRQLVHATEVRAEARGALAETRTLLVSRLAFARDQVEELEALQGRNQKLIEALARKAGIERGRIEQARATLDGMKAAHERHAREMEKLLDPGAAREDAARAREAVAGSAFSRGIGEILSEYFRQSRDKLTRAIAVIVEERNLMANVNRKMSHEYKIATVETAEFGTERFLVELDRIQEHCAREFKGGSSMLLKSRKALATLFFDTAAAQVMRIFEIADRETRAWMGGFVRPLESQLAAYQEQSYSRIEGMGRIQTAETDLIARLEEMRQLAAHMVAQREQHEAYEKRILELTEIPRGGSQS